MKKLFLTIAAVALVVAIVRFFLKAVVAPLGMPTVVASFLASITIVLVLGVGFIFYREANNPDGRFMRGAGWAALLSAWCQILIIGGILLTESLHVDTYFAGPWEMIQERFPNATAHVIGHTQGFFVLTALLLGIGGVVYSIARRKRSPRMIAKE